MLALSLALLSCFGLIFQNICYAAKWDNELLINEFQFKDAQVTISSDKNLLQLNRISLLHKQMYWAKDWTDEKIKKNIDNSNLCYGAYDSKGNQIGFARAVTDFSTVCYILDVVVDEPYRCKGIGSELVKSILYNEDLKSCSFVLAASVQARSFYYKLGFEMKNDKYMVFRVI